MIPDFQMKFDTATIYPSQKPESITLNDNVDILCDLYYHCTGIMYEKVRQRQYSVKSYRIGMLSIEVFKERHHQYLGYENFSK